MRMALAAAFFLFILFLSLAIGLAIGGERYMIILSPEGPHGAGWIKHQWTPAERIVLALFSALAITVLTAIAVVPIVLLRGGSARLSEDIPPVAGVRHVRPRRVAVEFTVVAFVAHLIAHLSVGDHVSIDGTGHGAGWAVPAEPIDRVTVSLAWAAIGAAVTLAILALLWTLTRHVSRRPQPAPTTEGG